MQHPPKQRRLAAIFAADVVGFSRQMGADEEGTLARLTRIREEVTDPAVAEFRGRIFKTTGDGILAEFPSVVDAVQCAAKVQIEMAKRGAGEPADKRIVFRIGINLGDVIVEGDDLYGDGVNVAARLEGICEQGGVAISGNAHEQVRGKVPFAFIDRGEQRVKNIARPVRVYALDLRAHGIVHRRRISPRLRRAGIVALVLALLVPLSYYFYGRWRTQDEGGVAGIAVLPFANQSGDPKRDYFSDGLTEDIINALGRFSGVRVTARNAVQVYKGRNATPDEVSRDLGVRYLVQGSVRESEGRVRVGVELSDAMKGTLLWSDRYEGEGKEVFEIQDRIVHNIVGVLAVKLTRLEQQRAAAKAPDSMEAYDLVLRARELMQRIEPGTNREARGLAARAIKLSPGYAEAHVVAAEAEFQRASFGFVEDVQASLQRTEEMARRALEIDDPGANARAHAVLGSVYSFTGRFEDSLAQVDKAIELNPSDASARGLRADALLWKGRLEESIAEAETARRFDPRIGGAVNFDLVMGYYLTSRYRDALTAAERELARTPDEYFIHALRAATLAQMGNLEEARKSVAQVRRIEPFFDAKRFGVRLVDPAHRAKVQEGLAKAGF